MTAEQRAFWEDCGFQPPDADAPRERRELFLASVRFAFRLEGLDPPSDEDALAGATGSP